MKLQKVSLGIRPSKKMFKLLTYGGELVDNILENRISKNVVDEYYSKISRSHEHGSISLFNKSKQDFVTVTLDDVIFVKDYYDSEASIKIEKFLAEIKEAWSIVDKVLSIKNIRRVGIVCEYRIDEEAIDYNKQAIELLTKFAPPDHARKFHLKYEEKRPTGSSLDPDFEMGDFANIIYEIYDSAIDAQHSEEGGLNINIDFQHYFSPILNKGIWDQVKILSRNLEDEIKIYKNNLKAIGLIK